MKNLLLFFLLFLGVQTTFGQKHLEEREDLDHVLLEPMNIRRINLLRESKYVDSKELPNKLSECINLQSIYMEEFRQIDLPKLFILLAKLPHLDSLEIYDCELKTIPKEIGLLTQLSYLKICRNELTEISPEISKLQSLEYLDLHSNKLLTLPNEIGDLLHLKELIICNNEFEFLPHSISKLNELVHLDVSKTLLAILPNDIQQLSSLRKINLNNTKLKVLPKSFKELDLEEISIGGEDNLSEGFPYDIFEIPTLKKIKISRIKLDSLPVSISKLNQLTSIHLIYLEKFDWKSAFILLGKVSSLKEARLIVNDTEVPKELTLLKGLTSLWIQSIKNPYQTLQYISEMTDLTSLFISFYEVEIVPPELVKLQKLQNLSFEITDLKSIPLVVCDLANLEAFSLYTQKKKHAFFIPKEIERLKNLKELSLSLNGNKLKPIPNELWNLSSLEYLEIEEGCLKNLPSGIGKLEHLESLNLSSNELIKLPEEISGLKNLSNLFLASNKFRQIDPNIYKISNLEFLYLRDNFGLKEVPEKIDELKNLKEIDLSLTQMTTLPHSLNNLENLKNIELSSTFFMNKLEMDSLFLGKIEWVQGSAKMSEKLLKMKRKFGKETSEYFTKNDTLILVYTYAYNNPKIQEEEYNQEITLTLRIDSILTRKLLHVPTSNILVGGTYSTVLNKGRNFKSFWGLIEFEKIRNEKIHVFLSLNGNYSGDTSREIIRKKVIFN